MLKKEELVQTPEYWLELIQNDLYKHVTKYMQKEGINQTELAKRLGVSKGYISQVLNGNFNYTLKKLIELSLAIGLMPKVRFESALPRTENVTKVKQSAKVVLHHTSKDKSLSKYALMPNINTTYTSTHGQAR